MLKEAVVYKSQGLFSQASAIFNKALQTVMESEALRSNETLIAAIKAKIEDVNHVMAEIDEAPETPEVSDDVAELIKKSFSFAKDKEAAAIEGAMALAKFGQHEKALNEFTKLLETATLPVMIAKNIIRCHLFLDAPEGAVDQFTEWIGGDRFSLEDKNHIRTFMVSIFESRGITASIPEIQEEAPSAASDSSSAEDELDIASVTITVDSGPKKGGSAEFEVSLQSGNTISIIIPAAEKILVQFFKHGMRLSEIQCFSPIGFFPQQRQGHREDQGPSRHRARQFHGGHQAGRMSGHQPSAKTMARAPAGTPR